VQEITTTLELLTPVLLLGGLAIFMTWEYLRPCFTPSAGRSRQRLRNLVLIAIGVAVSIVSSGLVSATVSWSEASSFGVLHRLSGRSLLSVVLGIFLVDLCLYTLHVSMHKFPLLWRIHRVHHSDAALDATSGLRAHPFELLYLLLMLALVLPLVGVSLGSYALYTALALPWFSLNHSNVKFPAWCERVSLLMSTASWHRVHHSSYQPNTDSHYGCVFSLWDRLFGTAGKPRVEAMEFGLETFREPKDQTVVALLRMPF
jgi:sterol desaturase/sphingolipid hydroxylase (fatty acid hydroxylase superfamily)